MPKTVKSAAGKMAASLAAFALLVTAFFVSAFANAETGGVKIEIVEEDPEISRQGEWSAKIRICNDSDKSEPAGILEARSSTVPISSALSMNSWAMGHMNFPTPVLLSWSDTKILKPHSWQDVELEARGSDFGGEWGPRPLEFFFASPSANCDVNSFTTVSSPSPLPKVPVSLIFVDSKVEAAPGAAEILVHSGSDSMFERDFEESPLMDLEKVQVITDAPKLRGAAGEEQPAQMRPEYLKGYGAIAKKFLKFQNLPHILVSPSPTVAELEEGKRMGFSAALIAAGTPHELLTPWGKITVLCLNPILTSLAEGSATSRWAGAESGRAGREARFLAQLSLLRGKREPVLIRIPEGGTRLLELLESVRWISFETLKNDLSFPYPAYYAPVEAVKKAPAPSSLASFSRDLSLASFLSSLSSRAKNWGESVRGAIFHSFLLTLSQNAALRATGSEALLGIGDELKGSVSLSSSKYVDILSERARIPITVRNSLPFPVKVEVRSLALNSQITIIPKMEASAKSGGESQILFPVSSHNSIQSEIDFWIGDFYHPITKISTRIDSHLTGTRLNVAILIIPAFLLIIFGAVRQRNRKKKNG